MIIGHLAISYLISQIPTLAGHPLPLLDQAAIVASGYVLDWDLLIPGKRGGANHHYLPTHTPFFAIILYGAIYALTSSFFQPVTMLLAGISMLLHLMSDDLDYWFYQLGFKKESKEAQIVWLYPLIKRKPALVARKTKNRRPILQAIGCYFQHPIIARTEYMLTGAAFALAVFQAVAHFTSVNTYLSSIFHYSLHF